MLTDSIKKFLKFETLSGGSIQENVDVIPHC